MFRIKGATEKVKSRSRKLFITVVVVLNIFHISGNQKKDGLIYILIWTAGTFEPFNFIDRGQKPFTNCTFNNCFLTDNHMYFKSILDYEVLLFNVVNLEEMNLPPNRSQAQKYFMFGVEPAAYHPIPEEFNGFFNYTFTYKLSSNVTIPCVIVKDQNDVVIGPKIDMKWMKLSEMNETSDYVKSKLQNKALAAAWIVSHCETPFRRLFARNLRKHLARYGHRLDIFGKCGTIPCPKGEMMDVCYGSIETDYYFYLAFENSFGEDYVTEKILNGLEHYAVPVVFGSANYSRFMPEGIYLDANVLSPQEVAEKMNEIIKSKTKYYNFFKWHGHYSFHFSGEDRFSAEVCRLCAFLNNASLMKQTSVYEVISDWWNEDWPTYPSPLPPTPDVPTEEKTYMLILEEEEPGLISKLTDFVSNFVTG